MQKLIEIIEMVNSSLSKANKTAEKHQANENQSTLNQSDNEIDTKESLSKLDGFMNSKLLSTPIASKAFAYKKDDSDVLNLKNQNLKSNGAYHILQKIKVFEIE